MCHKAVSPYHVSLINVQLLHLLWITLEIGWSVVASSLAARIHEVLSILTPKYGVPSSSCLGYLLFAYLLSGQDRTKARAPLLVKIFNLLQ